MKKILLTIGFCLFCFVCYAAEQATRVTTTTSSFNNNLSTADTTVQKALDTLDNMTSITGNAGTATALQANGANCSAGSAPLGVDASGAVESCTDFEEDLANSAGLYGALSDETGSASGTPLAVFNQNPSFTGATIATGSTLYADNISPTSEESIAFGSSASFLGDGNPSQFTTGITNYANETVAGYISVGSSIFTGKEVIGNATQPNSFPTNVFTSNSGSAAQTWITNSGNGIIALGSSKSGGNQEHLLINGETNNEIGFSSDSAVSSFKFTVANGNTAYLDSNGFVVGQNGNETLTLLSTTGSGQIPTINLQRGAWLSDVFTDYSLFDSGGTFYLQAQESAVSTTLFQASVGSGFNIIDGVTENFGTGFDAGFIWTTTGNDNFQLGLSGGSVNQSGYFSIIEKSDISLANRSPLATTANPTLRIYSSNALNALSYGELYHDDNRFQIASGSTSIQFTVASGSSAVLDQNGMNTDRVKMILSTTPNTTPNTLWSDGVHIFFNLATGSSKQLDN